MTLFYNCTSQSINITTTCISGLDYYTTGFVEAIIIVIFIFVLLWFLNKGVHKLYNNRSFIWQTVFHL